MRFQFPFGSKAKPPVESSPEDNTLRERICRMLGIPPVAAETLVEIIMKMNKDSVLAQLNQAIKFSSNEELDAANEAAEKRIDEATVLFETILNDNRLVADAREPLPLAKRIRDWLEYHP